MTFWLIAFTLALLAGGGFLFLVGQYNALVTVRHRIATVVLEIDFLLQQQAADLEANPKIAVEIGMMEEIRRAHAASHKATANPFEQGALEALNNAKQIVLRASREIGSMEMRDSQKRQLDNATVRLEDFVIHYRRMLGKTPASWIARRLLDA